MPPLSGKKERVCFGGAQDAKDEHKEETRDKRRCLELNFAAQLGSAHVMQLIDNCDR